MNPVRRTPADRTAFSGQLTGRSHPVRVIPVRAAHVSKQPTT